jgi:predicted nucleic acid-binding protein
VQRGNRNAAQLMEKTDERYLSIQTYMELLQSAKNKTQHKNVKDFLSALGFSVAFD